MAKKTTAKPGRPEIVPAPQGLVAFFHTGASENQATVSYTPLEFVRIVQVGDECHIIGMATQPNGYLQPVVDEPGFMGYGRPSDVVRYLREASERVNA